jgi:dihydrofolate synthase/folylpolyglutamate synthase
MEIFPGFPEVILDGAQSTAGVAALAAALAELPPAPTTLVFAAMDDKNIEEMAKIIAPHVGHVVATEVPGTDRTSSKRRIEDAFNHEEVHVIIASSPDSALAEARSLTPGSGRIVVAGSMYLVGAVRAELEAVQP